MMGRTRLKLTGKLIRRTPISVQLFLKRLGFRKLLDLVITSPEGELMFQTKLADKFKKNQSEVLKHWRRYRHLDKIKEICQFTPNTKVLDVGCGINTVLSFIEGKRYGLDPLANEYLKIYRYPEGIFIRTGVGEKIPFSDNYFDTVFCTNVLDHTNAPQEVQEVMNEVVRVLKKNGYFILAVAIFDTPRIDDPVYLYADDPAHLHTFTKREVFFLVRDHFQTIFQWEVPSVGISAYLDGRREENNRELILVLRRNSAKT